MIDSPGLMHVRFATVADHAHLSTAENQE